MQLSDSITLPAEVERARIAGELIVFAGAGVSMGPPSKLPSFEQLARDIAHPRVPWNDDQRQGLDQYLGKAQRVGVEVQTRARSLLSEGGSHTPLHENLIGVFGAADRVRLITTNFDSHFTAAASALFGDAELPHYWGPALPPGRDFRGVAHIHGALCKSFHRLILSDSDFAGAYMADGWAARFLVSAFENRTVLFVGYSVTDPLMRYLLLALPQTDRWFGLWPKHEIAGLGEHSITPISFQLATTGDPYAELTAATKQWKWYASAPAFAHGTEMKRLLKEGPPSSPIEKDYLRARLETDEGRQSFMRSTTDRRWFQWVADEGFLECLTSPADTRPAAGQWSAWCAQNFASGVNPALLTILRGRPTELHPALVTWLVRHFSAATPLGEPIPTRQFVALLATQPKSSIRDGHGWFWFAGALAKGGRVAEALALLRSATRVSLKPLERLYMSFVEEGPDAPPDLPAVSTGIAMALDSNDIVHFLDTVGEQLAREDAEVLFSIGEQRIAEAYELVELARSASGTSDYLSFGRTAVAPSNQDRSHQGEDVLVVLVRLAIDQWAKSDQNRLAAFARSRDADRRNLIRRLALHAYSMCTGLMGDDFLARAAEVNWASDMWVRPEFYSAVTVHFAAASEPARAAYVAHLADDGHWEEPFDKHSAHARFSLAQRLLRSAPGSAVAAAFAAGEKEAHPGFGEGDPDGFLSRVEVGWRGEEPSPIPVDELLAEPVEAVGKRILDVIEEEAKRGDGAYALSSLVQQLARTNPAWALAVAQSAGVAADPRRMTVIESLLWGLREVQPAPAGAAAFLRYLIAASNELPLHAFGTVIHKWSESIDATDADLCEALNAAADFAYEQSANTEPGIQNHGWTESAMNHPAGHAAQVWWAVASARNKVGGIFVLNIDESERRRWERVIGDAGANAAAARPILGMATERLFPGDAPWADAVLVPAFDPKPARERSAQLWDGRLMQSRWGIGVLKSLRPHRRALFAESAKLVPHRSQQLGDWVSMLAAQPDAFELDLTELHEFILGATLEARAAFARSIPEHLGRLSPDQRASAWHSLLKQYWADRRTGMPIVFSDDELAMLPTWVEALGEVADDAAHELEQTGAQRLEHAAGILFQWKEDPKWVVEHPAAACAIVEYLSKAGAIQTWDADDAVAVLEHAFAAGAETARICSVTQRLVAIPCAAAEALVARLNCAG